MTSKPTPFFDSEPDQSPPPDIPLVIIHHVTVLSASKGWRVTVRITDGWQGPTLSFWSRGGSSIAHGASKVADDLSSAYAEALEALEAFPSS